MKQAFNFTRMLAVIVAGLTCVCNATVASGQQAAVANGYCGVVGDVDRDGSLSIGDVSGLIDDLICGSPVNDFNDVDGNGQLNIADVTSMVDNLMAVTLSSTHIYAANGLTFRLVAVQGGTFTMGATSDQGSDVNDDEKPVHKVTLPGYFIAVTQVTQELWEAIMDDNPSGANFDPRCPVDNVSWNDCQEFIGRLNALTGLCFRLPTEAEWEFAARGGVKSKRYRYSGSNTATQVAWCEDNSGDVTHPVASKRCNELGLYDMSGNVWEWCQDWYGNYSGEAQTSPVGPESGLEHVVRGGCMRGHSRFCRNAYRMSYSPATRRIDVGLRLAL